MYLVYTPYNSHSMYVVYTIRIYVYGMYIHAIYWCVILRNFHKTKITFSQKLSQIPFKLESGNTFKILMVL